jgi:hypothetical protein
MFLQQGMNIWQLNIGVKEDDDNSFADVFKPYGEN